MRLFGIMISLSFLIVAAMPAYGQVRDEKRVAPQIQMMGEKKKEKPKARTGIVITSTSGEWDKVADEAGQIYVSRGYKGVVPGVRDESAVPAKKSAVPGEAKPARPSLEWIGFQPFATYSRVFLQLKGAVRYNVTKPKPDRIVLKMPDTDISTPNDLRYLDTSQFPTAVARVTIGKTKGDTGHTLVTIYLKKPVGYLYRQEGDYIFIDVGL